MTKKDKVELAWAEFDVASLPKKSKALYDAMKEANLEAAERREAFNDALRADLSKAGKVPDGMFVAVGHYFGKLSVAFTDVPPKKRGTAKELMTLG